jgi:hypothetical protein
MGMAGGWDRPGTLDGDAVTRCAVDMARRRRVQSANGDDRLTPLTPYEEERIAINARKAEERRVADQGGRGRRQAARLLVQKGIPQKTMKAELEAANNLELSEPEGGES